MKRRTDLSASSLLGPLSAKSRARSASAVLAGLMLLGAGTASAADIRVMISGGFSAAYRELVPEFERQTHDKVITVAGPSMGDTPQAIPNRLQRGEEADALIMVGEALDQLVSEGKVSANSRVPLALSPIGIAVRAGAPKPDISTVDALRQTLLNARSVAYSDSASGVYVGRTLYARLGIAAQMKDKSRMIPAEPVAAVVARGEAEIGFQQISELLPVQGITLVGPIPDEVQKITPFTGGIPNSAKNAEGGRALLQFLSSAQAAPVVQRTGLTPAAAMSK